MDAFKVRKKKVWMAMERLEGRKKIQRKIQWFPTNLTYNLKEIFSGENGNRLALRYLRITIQQLLKGYSVYIQNITYYQVSNTDLETVHYMEVWSNSKQLLTWNNTSWIPDHKYQTDSKE